MTISGGKTEQRDIFCCVTGFTSDFLSFIVVEHIRFFHGALQFILFASFTFVFLFTTRKLLNKRHVNTNRTLTGKEGVSLHEDVHNMAVFEQTLTLTVCRITELLHENNVPL